jgi:hypothetical protein
MTNKSGYLNNNGRQRMPKRFDRNGLKNLLHLHQADKQFREYKINSMKLGPSVMLQKVVNRSVLPPRKMKF